MILAAAIQPQLTMAVCTIVLFVSVDVIAGQVVETLLYGHSSGLSPLAFDADLLSVVIHVRGLEGHELLRAQARGVGELEHRAVAQLQRRAGRDRVEEASGLVRAEHPREARALAGRRDEVCRVVGDQAVLAHRTLELDGLVLEDKPLVALPADAARSAMLGGVRELGIDALPWDREARALQARIEFVRRGLGAR